VVAERWHHDGSISTLDRCAVVTSRDKEALTIKMAGHDARRRRTIMSLTLAAAPRRGTVARPALPARF
jgi:hypothetical protein